MMRSLATLFLASLALAACQTMPPKGPFTREQIATLEQNGFVAEGDGYQFGMADRLLFATDESVLISAQQGIISRMAASLTSVGVHGGRVEGHTDSTGTVAYNQALSQKRAQAVADALQAGGMAPAALQVIARGERDPIGSNGSTTGRKENRRVVIIVSPGDVLAH